MKKLKILLVLLYKYNYLPHIDTANWMRTMHSQNLECDMECQPITVVINEVASAGGHSGMLIENA